MPQVCYLLNYSNVATRPLAAGGAQNPSIAVFEKATETVRLCLELTIAVIEKSYVRLILKFNYINIFMEAHSQIYTHIHLHYTYAVIYFRL